MDRPQRSREAERYRPWYRTKDWFRARAKQLARRRWCERHIEKGEYVKATIVHHRRAHKGDWQLFIDPDNLVSLCKGCHDGPIQSEEVRGFSKAVDAAGYPTDPRHPVNRRRPRR